MIQRIQSLYLLLIVVLTGILLFAPLAWFGSEAGSFELHAFSLQSAAGERLHLTLYLGVLVAASCLLPLVTIFCFRNRMLQIRLCCVEMVLLLGTLIMEGVYYYLAYRVVADAAFHSQGFKPAIALPVVCLLLAFLAARAIFRDELLVRDADRIR